MLSIKLTYSGLLRPGKKYRDRRENILTTLVRTAQVETLSDYATGRLQPASLADRMKPGADAIYGFQRRSFRYDARKLRVLGAAIPYVSPRRRDYQNLAVAIAKGSAVGMLRAMSDLSTSQAHLRDLVKRPGSGFTVRPLGKSMTIKVRLRLPGARILNRSGGRDIFRKQLLDFSLGGGRDRKSIEAAFLRNVKSALVRKLTGSGSGMRNLHG